MKKVLLPFLICFIASNADAQDFYQPRYGLTYIQNFASQINYDPRTPENGKFQSNTLSAPGVGAFYERFIHKNISLTSQVAFQVKGFREVFQSGPSLTQNVRINKFRYATLEITPAYYFIDPSEDIIPFLAAGLNGNYLRNTQLTSRISPEHVSFPTGGEYSGNDFEKWSLGYNLAAGMTIMNLVILEGKFQKDITPILNEENLQIWNWVWSLNFKVNIGQIVRDYKKKNQH